MKTSEFIRDIIDNKLPPKTSPRYSTIAFTLPRYFCDHIEDKCSRPASNVFFFLQADGTHGYRLQDRIEEAVGKSDTEAIQAFRFMYFDFMAHFFESEGD